MKQLSIQKDLDDYIGKRIKKKTNKSILKDFFHRKEFSDRHMTISENQIAAIENSYGSDVIIVESEPNFFKVLHNKIMLFFKSKKTSKKKNK